MVLETKLGHSLSPELSDAQKKQLGADLRRKFLDAIPGLEPLIDAVKLKVRQYGRLRGLEVVLSSARQNTPP